MDYNELLIKRRSVRNYKDESVSENILLEIIRESTLAPNASHSQKWKFTIVNNKNFIKRISDESKSNILKRIDDNPADYAKKYETILRNPDYNVFYNAPALIIISGPADYKNLLIDCSLCAAYLMHGAADRGLGTCWVNLGSDVRNPGIREELGLTDELKIVAPIIIGYPVSIPQAPRREPPVILKIIS